MVGENKAKKETARKQGCVTRIEKDCFYVQTGVGELAVEELSFRERNEWMQGHF